MTSRLMECEHWRLLSSLQSSQIVMSPSHATSKTRNTHCMSSQNKVCMFSTHTHKGKVPVNIMSQQTVTQNMYTVLWINSHKDCPPSTPLQQTARHCRVLSQHPGRVRGHVQDSSLVCHLTKYTSSVSLTASYHIHKATVHISVMCRTCVSTYNCCRHRSSSVCR